jgi:hypothetical protein
VGFAIGVLALLAAGVAACVLLSDSSPPRDDTAKVALTAPVVPADLRDLSRWEVAEGKWTPRAGEKGPVLVQSSTDHTFNVILLREPVLHDVDVSVRFRPVSGREDASGGIVFRAQDGKNYLLVRANALEDNFRLYTVVDGSRSKIAGTSTPAPKLGEWHALRLLAVGDHVQAYLDGQLLIDHHEGRFTAGRIGLWTKADSVTEFDGLTVSGTR